MVSFELVIEGVDSVTETLESSQIPCVYDLYNYCQTNHGDGTGRVLCRIADEDRILVSDWEEQVASVHVDGDGDMGSSEKVQYLWTETSMSEVAQQLGALFAISERKRKEVDMYGSVEAMLVENDGASPELKVNTSAKPSLGDDINKGRRKAGKKKSVEKMTPEELAAAMIASRGRHAKIVKNKFNFFKPGEIDLNFTGTSGYKVNTKLKRDSDGKLSHSNEASIAEHIHRVLEDVAACMNLPDCVVLKEMTLFSLRPDIIVVSWNNCILLIVEVKNPGDLVMTHKYPAGQVLDYGYGSQQMGVRNPILCLSTYEQTTVCRLVNDDEGYKKIVERATKTLKDNNGKCGAGANPKSVIHRKEQLPTSPGSLLVPPTAESIGGTPSAAATDQEDSPPGSQNVLPKKRQLDGSGSKNGSERSVAYSEVYGRETMYKALTLALACGIEAAEDAEPRWKGTHYDGIFPCLTASSRNFKHFNMNVRFDNGGFSFNKNVTKDNSKVVLLSHLGSGGSGKVCLGCTSTGRAFAVKLYIPGICHDFNEEEKIKALAKKLCVRRQERNREGELWIELYGDEKWVTMLSLHYVPCLTMPFLYQFRMEDRKKVTALVRAELMRFAEKGYKYKKSDLRWRHVGNPTTNANEIERVILMDLGSLEKLDKKMSKKKRKEEVESQMTQLIERMGKEEPVDDSEHKAVLI